MKSRMSGYALANIAMMRGPRRRHLPVLILQFGLEVAPNTYQCRYDEYWVLPAPDKDTANQACDILRNHGWKDYRVPQQFENVSLSLSPPTNGSNPGDASDSNRPPVRSDSGPGDFGDPSNESNPMNPSETPVSISTGKGEVAQFPPNLVALAILRQVRDRQNNRRETDSGRTQELIREARAGGVHGYDSTN